MNKQEAAAMLGVSERTVAAHVAAGRLSVRYVKGKTRDVADYDHTEVENLAKTLNNTGSNRETVNHEVIEAETVKPQMGIVKHSEFLPQVPNHEVERPVLQGFTVLRDEQFETLLEKFGPPAILSPSELAAKTTITVAEASALTGFPEETIRKAIKNNELKGIKIGRPIRVRPADVQTWANKHFE